MLLAGSSLNNYFFKKREGEKKENNLMHSNTDSKNTREPSIQGSGY